MLVVPPATPATVDRAAVMAAGIRGWAQGIDALGADWLRAGLHIHVYIGGTDDIPEAALQDIIVLGAET